MEANKNDKPRRYLITLKSGQRHITDEFDNDEAVLRWINTGVAGILYKENVRLYPDDIANIQPIEENDD